MKVAIVCDWLTGIGGAERVVLELHRMYPEAPIYTSQYDPSGIDWFKRADVRTGWLNKLPRALRKFLPVFRAWHFSHLDLREYDLVISSSGAEAKGLRLPERTVHVSYCHSPTHYYWNRYEQYMEQPGFGRLDWLARFGLRVSVGPMRRWDRRAAQRPTLVIANSHHTQKMILKYYGRESTVIFPPVDIDKFRPVGVPKRAGFIIVGRHTPYKRIDLALQACSQLGLPLTVVGDGPDHTRLKSLAGHTIDFRGEVSEREKIDLLQHAEAFIFPNEEDFGISAVEAMAAGCPVIALKAWGALDTVQEGVSGTFFLDPTVESLITALESFHRGQFKSSLLLHHVEQFSTDNFRQKMSELVNSALVK